MVASYFFDLGLTGETMHYGHWGRKSIMGIGSENHGLRALGGRTSISGMDADIEWKQQIWAWRQKWCTGLSSCVLGGRLWGM